MHNKTKRIEKATNYYKKFALYVSENILGMMGVSLYYLTDTFFISQVAGANGITVLNLSLPVYGLLFAFGAMVGVGAATRYSIAKAQKSKEADLLFGNAIFWLCLVSVPFVLIAFTGPDKLLKIMGGDAQIIELGIPYVRTFLFFSAFFMLNHVFNAFTRNDGAPSVAMVAMLIGSGFNIVFDYIFMFPMHMGLAGAALATGASPIVGMSVCLVHLASKKSGISFRWVRPSIKRLWRSCQLGVSALIGELSSAIITLVFNFLILDLAGNIGVAAYGIVANIALVASEVFNGIAQGSQPLISYCYGAKDYRNQKKLLNMGLVTALLSSALIIGIIWKFTDPIIAAFNSEGSSELAIYAREALRIYILGYLMAGINVVLSGYFSAANAAKEALICSMLRGIFAIIFFSIVLSRIFGLIGVWSSFPAAEMLTLFVSLYMCIRLKIFTNNKGASV